MTDSPTLKDDDFEDMAMTTIKDGEMLERKGVEVQKLAAVVRGLERFRYCMRCKDLPLASCRTDRLHPIVVKWDRVVRALAPLFGEVKE